MIKVLSIRYSHISTADQKLNAQNTGYEQSKRRVGVRSYTWWAGAIYMVRKIS